MEEIEELQTKVEDLEKKLNERINSLENNISKEQFGTYTGQQSRDNLQKTTERQIADMLWKRVFYMADLQERSFETNSASFDFTQTTPDESNTRSIRLGDTTAGTLFNPKRPSKFRLTFYITQARDESTSYILSPVVFQNAFFTNTDKITDFTFSFVGIKIDKTVVSLVSSDQGAITERTTSFIIDDTATYELEINYEVNNASIYIDEELLGVIPCNLLGITDFETFFLYLGTTVSGDTNTVKITYEGFEFLQSRAK